jgi:hypothetical protein
MISTPERPQRQPAIPRPPRAADSGRDPMETNPPAAPPPVRTPQPAQPTTRKEAPVARKQLTTWISAEVHKRMQRMKVETDMDLKDQVDEALQRFLAEKGF